MATTRIRFGLYFVLAGAGCQDIAAVAGGVTTGGPGGESSSGPVDDGTTRGDPTLELTTAEPESSGQPDPSDTGGTSTGETSSSDAESSSESGVPVCGNDVVDEGEVCDGPDLAGSDCAALGFEGGELGCAADCSGLDTSACVLGSCCTAHEGFAPGCADAACEADVCMFYPECCSDEWVPECADLAFMVCPACSAPNICGNHVAEAGEACDNEDLAGATCADAGFDGGLLDCAADCSGLDTTNCQMFAGDCCTEHLAPGCDDLACANAICDELGICCFTWDEVCAELAMGYCDVCGGGGGGDCCSPHMEQGCNDLDCMGPVCLEDDTCCTGEWDATCADLAASMCPACASCGDGYINGGDACDGEALAAESCETQGFVAGTLACAPDCTFDTSACIASGGGDCCSANGLPGCADEECTTDVCYADESCCTSGWHEGCVELAISLCETCGGDPPLFGCVEQNLGSAVGPAVASGSTALADDDVVESCGNGGGVDHVLLWTSPADGEYTVDTIGSSFDTVVSVGYFCDSEFICDDDGAGGGASEVSGYVPAGFEVVISISGSSGASGDWVVNITAA